MGEPTPLEIGTEAEGKIEANDMVGFDTLIDGISVCRLGADVDDDVDDDVERTLLEEKVASCMKRSEPVDDPDSNMLEVPLLMVLLEFDD